MQNSNDLFSREERHWLRLSEALDTLHKAIQQTKDNPVFDLMDHHIRALRDTPTLPPALLLDFYFTLNSLYKTFISEEPSETALKGLCLLFLIDRATVLQGDSLDYPNQPNSPGNQFCLALAQYLFPEHNPANVVLQSALSADRPSPWKDPFSQSPELPPLTHFFRTDRNNIELYEAIIIQAIERLKEGFTEDAQIWLGTDVEKQGPYSLTPYSLSILKQRTPTLAILFEYIDDLKSAQKGLYARLNDLYGGLRAGGTLVTHQADAGSAANIAIQRFGHYWTHLDTLPEGVAFKNRVLAIDNRFGPLLNNLFINTPIGNHLDPNLPGPCIEGTASNLQNLLRNEAFQKQILELEQNSELTLHAHVSHAQLDQWQQKILSELAETPLSFKLNTPKHFFDNLIHKHDFMESPFFSEVDYRLFSAVQEASALAFLFNDHPDHHIDHREQVMENLLFLSTDKSLAMAYICHSNDQFTSALIRSKMNPETLRYDYPKLYDELKKKNFNFYFMKLSKREQSILLRAMPEEQLNHWFSLWPPAFQEYLVYLLSEVNHWPSIFYYLGTLETIRPYTYRTLMNAAIGHTNIEAMTQLIDLALCHKQASQLNYPEHHFFINTINSNNQSIQNRLSMVILLVQRGFEPAEQPCLLENEYEGDSYWQFVIEYITQLGFGHFSSAYLNQIVKLAIEQRQEDFLILISTFYEKLNEENLILLAEQCYWEPVVTFISATAAQEGANQNLLNRLLSIAESQKQDKVLTLRMLSQDPLHDNPSPARHGNHDNISPPETPATPVSTPIDQPMPDQAPPRKRAKVNHGLH